VIALVPAERVDAVGAAVRSAVRAAGYEDPAISQTYAAEGASAT
jgi:galactokinase